MIKIEETTLLHDTRNPGENGMVIGQHRFADGEIWPAVFEGLADEDVELRLKDMVPQREADREAGDLVKASAAVLSSAIGKASVYVKALDNPTLQSAGLTAEEITALKATDNVVVSDVIAGDAL